MCLTIMKTWENILIRWYLLGTITKIYSVVGHQSIATIKSMITKPFENSSSIILNNQIELSLPSTKIDSSSSSSSSTYSTNNIIRLIRSTTTLNYTNVYGITNPSLTFSPSPIYHETINGNIATNSLTYSMNNTIYRHVSDLFDEMNTLTTLTTTTSSTISSTIVDHNNGTSKDNFYNSSWNIHLLWYTIFGLMITIGLIANLLIVATISGHKSLHTVTNCFLLNLTISDLVTLLFNAIFNLVFMLNGHWPFGKTSCVMTNFITNLTIAASVFTIIFTSKERYNAIVHPLRKRLTKRRAIVQIVIIWLASSLFALPTLVFSRTVDIRFPSGPMKGQIQRTICLLKWPDGYVGHSRFDFIYNLLFLVLTYILPLMSMAIAYTLMARVLWGSKQIGESTQAQMNLVCSKQKVVRMLICVVAVFGVCWLPYHIYFLCTYQWPQLVARKATQHIYLGIYWLAMSNSMLNPIILLLMNRRFRRYSTKFLNCNPFNRVFSCIASAQSLPSEACHTAIVTLGPNHQEAHTVLLNNGLKEQSHKQQQQKQLSPSYRYSENNCPNNNPNYLTPSNCHSINNNNNNNEENGSNNHQYHKTNSPEQ
ncbi:hypothetical protein RDWZM_004673 [Blomia tropicalis]|uniref:G-protein coupled receptors family 1 profile domain-containing protein n=1 Tax=Blomia tropicalis TaxID=40697 RepID=A0A9Q0RMT3_BLOTA|nr:hypothetical protein RDWZM_004673 [Blomia tropicalis]